MCNSDKPLLVKIYWARTPTDPPRWLDLATANRDEVDEAFQRARQGREMVPGLRHTRNVAAVAICDYGDGPIYDMTAEALAMMTWRNIVSALT